MKKPSAISPAQLQRMRAGIQAEIQHHQRCLDLLPTVPRKVLKAGRELFKTDAAVALWLCQPARALGGKYPMVVAQTPAGAKQVAQILGAIGHGVFL